MFDRWDSAVRIQMLGPLQVWDGATWSTIRAAQQRLLLAVLLAEPHRAVSTERLVDEIWGEHPPRTAVKVVQGYVLRLRRALDRHLLVARGHGYQLMLDDDDLDARVFERLVRSGKRRLSEGQVQVGADLLAEALDLWRGPALADVSATPTVAAEVSRLEQVRLTAREDWFRAQIDLGRHTEVVDELHELVTQHPLRERLREQLMLALYRSGRRAEALDSYREGRRVMTVELGLEPGPPLRELQDAILADDGRLAVPAVPAATPLASGPTVSRPAPAHLPADVPGFVGRAGYTPRFDAFLTDAVAAHEVDPTVKVMAIAGTAGVGKTALAVHWAHRVRNRFPDGQLYVNLCAYGPSQPLRPIEALARFLEALGVPAKEIPIGEEQAVGLYRTLLNDRRVLVLLDNADDPDQVRPLLPGTGGCLVLVTSRNRMAGLVALNGAVQVTLDVFTSAEAEELLTHLLGGDRVDAEQAAVAELTALCAHLPLALRIAAAKVANRSRHAVADYVTELRTGDRFAALEVDGDPQAAVRAAFDLSYAVLHATTQRLFRLLGLHPGPDITVLAAAALAGTAPAAVARMLDQLSSAHLVDQYAPGRYSLHDLLRLYASTQAVLEDSHGDRRAALDRLFEFYLRSLGAVAEKLYPIVLRPPLPTVQPAGVAAAFDNDVQAAAWLDAERLNLRAAITYTSTHGARTVARHLADALRGCLFLRAYPATGLPAGDRRAMVEGRLGTLATSHLSLALRHFIEGRHQPAADHFAIAANLANSAGWPEGESIALGHLADAYLELGQLPDAAAQYGRALAIDQRLSNGARHAGWLANLGVVELALGRLAPAADHLSRAVVLQRRTGSLSGEARSLAFLGEAHHRSGLYKDALAALIDALALHRQLGEVNLAGSAIRALAVVYRDTGHYAVATDHAGTAVAMARKTADRHHEADALATQASIHLQLGQLRMAIDGYQSVLDLARDVGNREAEVETLVGLATAHRRCGDVDRARGYAYRALTISRKAAMRMLEGQALTVLATVQLDQNTPDQAIDTAEQALVVHAETGHRLGAAQTHLVLDRSLNGVGEVLAAEAHHNQAIAIFASIGIEWADYATRLFGAESDVVGG